MASPPPDAMDEEIPSVGGILSLPQSVKAIQASEGGNSVPMARVTFVEERGFVKGCLGFMETQGDPGTAVPGKLFLHVAVRWHPRGGKRVEIGQFGPTV
jgi:hypothetical protein